METLIQSLWDAFNIEPKTVSPSLPQDTITPVENKKVIDFDEIAAIEYEYGKIEEGAEVVVELQKLLTICPRTRRRADAYKGLISKVRKEKNATLIVKSQKSK